MRNTISNGQNRIGKLLLIIWAIAIAVAIASLSVGHMASLPEPEDGALLSRALLQLRRSSNGNFLVHVIYSECSCTRALFTHLITRGPFKGAEELILFVGTDARKQEAARRAGFGFTVISASQLVSRFGLEAAPVLVLFDSKGRLRYAGGYFDHPAALIALDERIHAQLADGGNVEPLPVFGCAVSPRLQKSLSPLGVLSPR